MSDTASGLSDEREIPFVDPWSKKPNHQGMVPVDALFVGAWENDLGIDNINEALFLVRDERQDLLWSLTNYRANYQGELGRPAMSCVSRHQGRTVRRLPARNCGSGE